jgi:hypothetical protein
MEKVMHKSDVEQHIAILESALKAAKNEHTAKRLSELIALLDELQCLREMLDYLVDVIPERKLERWIRQYRRRKERIEQSHIDGQINPRS